MVNKRFLLGILVMVFGLVFCFFLAGCVSVGVTQALSPNVSQFVITVTRGDYATEKGKKMEIYLDGRKTGNPIKNGGQEQILVTNGIHNLYVKVGRYQSQMLTFEGNSEVIEFRTNFEGSSKRSTQLYLTKVFGGK